MAQPALISCLAYFSTVRHVPPKRLALSELQDVTTRKIAFFIVTTAVRISNQTMTHPYHVCKQQNILSCQQNAALCTSMSRSDTDAPSLRCQYVLQFSPVIPLYVSRIVPQLISLNFKGDCLYGSVIHIYTGLLVLLLPASTSTWHQQQPLQIIHVL
jgi:hypothetical protein